MAENGKWVYSSNEENFSSDEFDSLEDAKAQAKSEDYDGAFFGQVENVDFEDAVLCLDADDVIERIGERLYEEVGDACEGWPSADTEQEMQLTTALRDVVVKWLNDTGNQPRFFKVVNVEYHDLSDSPPSSTTEGE